jgi:aldehyde dehydrogenase (NAD+)
MIETAGLIDSLATLGFLVDGEWADGDGSGGLYPHHNPTTGALDAQVSLAGAADVDRAVAAAKRAFPAWRDLAPDARAALLFRLADLLEANAEISAVVAALENGTPVGGLGPARYAAQWVRYYAGWVDKIEGQVVPVYPNAGLNYIRPEPYGVVGLLIPWNSPMAGMGQKCAAALAAGNTVVAKPSELAPFGAYQFAELAQQAGFPPGVLNVVAGGPEAGNALVRHPDVAKVSLTGGLVTARKVMAACSDSLKPLALELGGKSANIIFDDAELSAAIPMAAALGVVVLSGQGCALPTRVYAHDSVYDEVVAGIVESVAATPIGDPLDPGTAMGPVITLAACERILGTIETAKRDHAGTLLTGGSRVGGSLAAGYFIEPTVFGDVDQRSDIARNEIFGPVLSVLRFSGDEEVVDLANDSEFGLGAYIHTADSQRAIKVAHALQAGYVNVNGFAAMSPSAPFGGYKASGFGREGGRAGLEEYLQAKNVFFGLGASFAVAR